MLVAYVVVLWRVTSPASLVGLGAMLCAIPLQARTVLLHLCSSSTANMLPMRFEPASKHEAVNRSNHCTNRPRADIP